MHRNSRNSSNRRDRSFGRNDRNEGNWRKRSNERRSSTNRDTSKRRRIDNEIQQPRRNQKPNFDNKGRSRNMGFEAVQKLLNNDDLEDSEREKEGNKYFWNDTDNFWMNVICIAKTFSNFMPMSSCETILKLLKALTLNIPNLESNCNIHVSDEIKTEIQQLCDAVEKTSKTVERKTYVNGETSADCYVAPPNNFRDINIFPNNIEITSQLHVFLRPNIIKGPYQDVEHYLDVQYRLYREDFVLPLRNGICKYLENNKNKLENIRIYRDVQFLNRETVSEQNCYRLQYDFRTRKKSCEFENSKRFMYGSLLCFTHDNFKSILFATVAARSNSAILESGQLLVAFTLESVLPQNLTNIKFLMVESTVFFEPYYQVLNALKRMSTVNFPMERYIIRVETETRPPQYLKTSPPLPEDLSPMYLSDIDEKLETLDTKELTAMQDSSSNVVLPLDYDETDTLNEAQSEAFQSALTKEFAIIQGPPGTGKTFLGLKIAKTLLLNEDRWYKKTPMLVICYTNHALDQFLEGLLPVTQNIIRIGSQSKNERIKMLNIRNRSRNLNYAVIDQKREVSKYLSRIDSVKNNLNEIDKYSSVVDFNVFYHIVKDFKGSWFDNASRDNIINWLLEESQNFMSRRNRRHVAQAELREQKEKVTAREENKPLDIEKEENLRGLEDGEIEDDIFDYDTVFPIFQLISTKTLLESKKHLQRRYDRIEEDDNMNGSDNFVELDQIRTELYIIHNQLEFLEFRLKKGEKNKNTITRPNGINMRDPYEMPYDLRWQCYFYWLSLYKNHLEKNREDLIRKFQKAYGVYKELNVMVDTQTMKEALVIGMTTTCAARHHASLQALKVPIVIVEEAAEILESHIIAALTSHCEHLILIGDHQQLKPSTANYKIETKFKLGVSLFERMILNNIQCHTLNVQHRMRPEIANLIRPSIYPVLEDDKSVLERNHIRGVDHDLFFIDHAEQEQVCNDNSKKNVHEAKFFMQFAKYLVLNGYKSNRIVILAAYLGQMFEMQKLRRTYGNFLENVRIAVLDNYQGEESDIILLSLVRNNKDNQIGFLKLENRVCVALSRARNGLYIMGNMKLLNENSIIWSKINETLQRQKAIGTHLTLRCSVHKHNITKVSTADDFSKFPEGGCDLLCATPLRCGHVCTRLCHIEDRDHEDYECKEKCQKIICENTNHDCDKLCYEECDPCCYLVDRHLDCGHVTTMKCHLDPKSYKCPILIVATLPCAHKTLKPCFEDPEKFQCPFPCDTRVEPCGHSCMMNCHVRNDPDHLTYLCKKPCDKICQDCTASEKHICPKLCYRECKACEVEVIKRRSCGHILKMACSVDPESKICYKLCKKILACGHKCKKMCSQSCEPCEEMVEKTIPDCNHVIQIECFQSANRKFCKQKCPRLLPCGHVCDKRCNEDCTKKCKEIVDCSILSPCGHTIKKVYCFAKENNDEKILVESCTERCNAELACKHKCAGTCAKCLQGRFHQKCQEKCGVILVCNHECPIPCREACKPCRKPCEYRCEHSQCKKSCGDPCTPCKEKCQRKCRHQECLNRCGQICTIEPCTKPCPKKLRKCRHSCVGFCGDPCPQLCKICNKDQLTEVFFGTEDDEDARFVLLQDCGHVMESTGMKKWLKQDNQKENGEDDLKIQPLVCPKCKTVIKKTARYSDYVKQSMHDLKNVKTKFYGERKEVVSISRSLQSKFPALEIVKCGNDSLYKVYNKLLEKLQYHEHSSRHNIAKMDLDGIRIKIELIQMMIEPLTKDTLSLSTLPRSNDHISLIAKYLGGSVFSISQQEVNDISLEINRLHRWIQLERLTDQHLLNDSSVKTKVESIVNALNKYCRYDETQDGLIKISLEELKKLTSSKITLSETEKKLIVKAVGLARGHWYKCSNGHPYAIGECGGAMEISKCYECGVPIGGRQHRLIDGNAVATEMDGATAGAWSEQANMANYDLI